MLKWTLFICLCGVPNVILAQQGNVWAFGENNRLDFNTTPPGVDVSGIVLEDIVIEGTASISDSLGRLLFYSDGIRLWDWNHEVIVDTLRGHQSSTHAAYIVPVPGASSQYYLFTLDAVENQLQNGLRYSLVTACRDEGVTVRDVNTLLAANMTEKMVAVRHGNGRDFWLVTHEFGNDRFKVFLIDPQGIQSAMVQALGTEHLNPFIPASHGSAVGAIKASPNGNMISVAITNQPTVCEMFGFNKSSGVLNHLMTFASDTLSGQYNSQVYGLSFSANSEYLYLSQSSGFKVWQFRASHLLNSDTQGFLNSRGLVYSSEVATPGVIKSFQHIQLGPNGKIYLVNLHNRYMAVIHEPDMPGLQCHFEDSALHLLNPASYGLPSFIDSYDYTISGFCNPNGLDEMGRLTTFTLYPNPATHKVRVEVSGSRLRVQSVVLTDMLGRTVLSIPFGEVGGAELDVSGLPAGVYTVAATLRGRELLRQRLVVQ